MDMQVYWDGERLYGDDFSLEDIIQWYRDEAEAYADLGARDRTKYVYKYHALNRLHGFRFLRGRACERVLSVGGAYGDELEPVWAGAKAVTILDSSAAFAHSRRSGPTVSYVHPEPSGEMPFQDASFDLVTCFGCLHHVPNVSFVVREIVRCLSAGGMALIREPIVSMGDWRSPRPGLTKRERGIPLSLFRSILAATEVRILREQLCGFPLIRRLEQLGCPAPYNVSSLVLLDHWLSRLFAWKYRYHARTAVEKLRPTAVAYVVQKI